MSSTPYSPPVSSTSEPAVRVPYASWASSVCLLHGLVYLYAAFAVIQFQAVAGGLAFIALMCLLLAFLARLSPRITRWLAALVLIGLPGFCLVALSTDGISFGPWSTLEFWGSILFGAAISGLLSTRHGALARLLLVPTLITLLAGLATAVAGKAWLEQRARAHLHKVDVLAARLATAPAAADDLPSLLAKAPPASARAFAATLRALQTDPAKMAELVADEVWERAKVCFSLSEQLRRPLTGHESRQEHIAAVCQGLRGCPLSDVDFEALEYVLLFLPG
jgi:hypothetical protein